MRKALSTIGAGTALLAGAIFLAPTPAQAAQWYAGGYYSTYASCDAAGDEMKAEGAAWSTDCRKKGSRWQLWYYR
ncbi:hypothetical protein DP939_37165 [Spongiactinospora rosea]|uniref:Uncharacterized protein n=1 Tax=Spongiactinospora rosea TaxID=2248750 RepID=A0A366LM85_9ACTN|nr:hypothetical protein [Spongiactinospora rosea]RBQ15036.1 hypothetical protein DP939_37165 [Spongiactinospora rosea]